MVCTADANPGWRRWSTDADWRLHARPPVRSAHQPCAMLATSITHLLGILLHRSAAVLCHEGAML